MIDWLTFVAPLAHVLGEGGPFYAGEVMATDSQGALDWGIWKRDRLESSFSTVITVRSTLLDGRPAIEVAGSPAKWFQGHNVFGSDDLAGLVREMLARICASRGVAPTAEDIASWEAGDITLHRVDVTRSWDLGTLPRVRNALRSLDATAHLRHRGRGHFMGDSLTYGKGSRRWSFTLYAKGAEIMVHKLPLVIAETSVPSFAQGLLRGEIRLMSMQLQAEQLDKVSAWGETTAEELHQRYSEKLHIAEASMLDAKVLDGLPGRLQLAYQAWKDGHDLRATLPRNTFYRYRAQLLAHGVDIAVKQERSPEASNVVPLRTVLHAYPAEVPSWAVGTPLFFEPRRRFG